MRSMYDNRLRCLEVAAGVGQAKPMRIMRTIDDPQRGVTAVLARATGQWFYREPGESEAALFARAEKCVGWTEEEHSDG